MEGNLICPNPEQCAAFHELASHMSEMNTKLTSVMSILQLFFQSWKLSESNNNNNLDDPNISTPPPAPKPSFPKVAKKTINKPSPRVRSIGHIVQTLKEQAIKSEEKLHDPFASEESLPVLLTDDMGFSNGDDTEDYSDFHNDTTMDQNEEDEVLSNPEPGPSSSYAGSPFSAPKRNFSSFYENYTKRRTSGINRPPPSKNDVRRGILLYPGKIVSSRALGHRGPLSYYRKRKSLTYEEMRVELESMASEGLLMRTKGRQFEKVDPDTPAMLLALPDIGITVAEYTNAFEAASMIY